jgi:hypothetical protein
MPPMPLDDPHIPLTPLEDWITTHVEGTLLEHGIALPDAARLATVNAVTDALANYEQVRGLYFAALAHGRAKAEPPLFRAHRR